MIENPVLRAFAPDPSIVRVGEDFYVATSTFEWFPGVRLHHSRDLVHWRQLDAALTRPSQLELRGVPDSGGVWAPSLSHCDGQFWLVYTNVRTCGIGRPFKDLGVYLVTAPSISGPWSEPIRLNAVGFDPSLFHDDDGRKWLVNMQWDHRKTGVARFAGIVIQEYDPAKRRFVGEMTKILEKPVLCEGPNLYKRDGWYYLMTAEGGTGWEHGIAMARSRRLGGPYELDPSPAVLTTRDAPEHSLQKAGHGELVETAAGEWYLVHLASRPLVANGARRCLLGRETCLQKVRWTEDGWLRLSNDGLEGGMTDVRADDRRIRPWHPALTVPAPAGVTPHRFAAPSARDDFNAILLGPAWSALRVPPDETWLSLKARPGWLRIRGRESLHSLFYQSLVAKPLPATRCVVETCLEFVPRAFAESAGLVCYYDTRTHFYLRVTHDEAAGTVLGIVESDDGVYREPVGVTEDWGGGALLVSDQGDAGGADAGRAARERDDGNLAGPGLGQGVPVSPARAAAPMQVRVNGWPRFFLRATFAEAELRFFASPDGQAWRAIGPALDASKLSDDYGSALHFTGATVGVCVQDLAGNDAVADFDYFSVSPPASHA